MAMALLGLGLTFIRGMMGGATGKLGGAIDAADLSEPPSFEKPIVIDKNIKLKGNSNVKIKIGFYNTGDTAVPAEPILETCYKSDDSTTNYGGTSSPKLTLMSISQNAESGKPIAFESILKSEPTASTGFKAGTYVCNLKIADKNTQFFIELSN